MQRWSESETKLVEGIQYQNTAVSRPHQLFLQFDFYVISVVKGRPNMAVEDAYNYRAVIVGIDPIHSLMVREV